MKKKFIVLLTTLGLSCSVVGVALFANNAPLKIKADQPYSCELPSGYVEIEDVANYVMSVGTSVSNPYNFRGTVTRRYNDEVYVQRVNQSTFYRDAIKITNVNSYADYLVEGNVVDVSGGTLFIDSYQPCLRLDSSDDLFVSFDENPTGYDPCVYQTFDEWDNAQDYNEEYMAYSRLINISKAKVEFYETYNLSGDDYDVVTFSDLFTLKQYDAVLLSDDNSAIKSKLDEAISEGKTVSVTCVLTTLLNTYSVLYITNVDDIVVGDSYLDTDVVSGAFTSHFYYYYSSGPQGLPFGGYYLIGKGDVPYVDFRTFIYDLAKIFYNDPSYFLLDREIDGNTFHFYQSYLSGLDFYLNAEEDTFAFSNPYLSSINTNEYGTRYFVTGIETNYCLIDNDLSKTINPASLISYDLSQYDIDLVVDKYNNIYMPMTILMDIMLSDTMYNFGYNGKDFYFLNATVSNSSLRNWYYYDSPNANASYRSQEMAEFTYNEFAFLVENIYGLATYEIPTDSSFDAIVSNMGLKEDMLSIETVNYETAVAEFVARWLSDGHASYYYPSPYVADNYPDYINIGTDYSGGRNNRVYKLYQDFAEIGALRNTAGKDIGLEIYEDTAIIRFDEFVKYPGNSSVIDVDSYSYSSLHNAGSELLFRKAFKEIEEHGGINNVVVDITNNGGGMIDSLPWLEAYFTSDPSLTLWQKRTGEIIETHYKVDLDYDGIAGDTYEGEYNYFLLTSNCSFSCGNYLPTVIKEKGAMTIIGETSGGGECSVDVFATAAGTIIRNSSNNHLGYYDYDNNRFVGNDGGITPDYEYPRSKFYDVEYLRNFINTL